MHQEAIGLLRAASTPFGILASINDETNYRRVWSRDSVICGLAGLLGADEKVGEGLKQSLISLAKHQGPQGQMPSNVQLDEKGALLSLSFGGLCGRVDTVSWWIVGLCNYLHAYPDAKMQSDYLPNVEKGFELLSAWEFNGKGLMYIPQSGNWADEYLLRAYVLFDQLLRLWALQAAAKLYGREDWEKQAIELRAILERNYWIGEETTPDLYHQHAYELTREQAGPSPYWVASFGPGGYIRYFDLLANALALLLGIGNAAQKKSLLAYTESVSAEMPHGLLPAFWEPILPEHPDWALLQANYKYHFRNQPYEFQNGGIWPVFNGWWGMALVQAGEREKARQLLAGLSIANAKENNGFYECLHGQSGEVHGTKQCTWSAAGWIMLDAYLNGRQLMGF